jgi:hypothetical protein
MGASSNGCTCGGDCAAGGEFAMSAHTPGPWSYRQWAQSDEHIAEARSVGLEPTPMMGNGGERYVTGPDCRICEVVPVIQPKRGRGYGHEDAERDANARLIAAAPELLEAAKLACQIAESWIHDQLDGTSSLAGALEHLKPVHAAIAKATQP